MRLISHRGNIYGKQIDKENKISHIDYARGIGYDVEIDVRECLNGRLFLGHDYADESLPLRYLADPHIWVHLKDSKSIDIIKKLEKRIVIDANYFIHERDPYTLTSDGHVWVYPGDEIVENCILVITKNHDYDLSDNRIFGICSDYVGECK